MYKIINKETNKYLRGCNDVEWEFLNEADAERYLDMYLPDRKEEFKIEKINN